jgi:hypothetical protein
MDAVRELIAAAEDQAQKPKTAARHGDDHGASLLEAEAQRRGDLADRSRASFALRRRFGLRFGGSRA